MTTDVDVLNSCLARLGAAPVESRTDPNAAAAWCCYDDALLIVLGGYPWKCGRRTRQLARVTVPPEEQWPYAFQVPVDLYGQPRACFAEAGAREPYAGWERSGRLICADVPALWMRYTRLTTPDEWPPLLAACVKLAVMAELALAVREDQPLRDRLMGQLYGTPGEQQAGGLLAQARSQDAMGEPAPTIAMGDNPLVSARSGWSFAGLRSPMLGD